MMGPAAAAAHAQQLNEDNRQALVLFGIVIIFLACNIPRVVLNFHEVQPVFFVQIETTQESILTYSFDNANDFFLQNSFYSGLVHKSCHAFCGRMIL